jgi:hypothetical protein
MKCGNNIKGKIPIYSIMEDQRNQQIIETEIRMKKELDEIDDKIEENMKG